MQAVDNTLPTPLFNWPRLNEKWGFIFTAVTLSGVVEEGGRVHKHTHITHTCANINACMSENSHIQLNLHVHISGELWRTCLLVSVLVHTTSKLKRERLLLKRMKLNKAGILTALFLSEPP